MDRRVFLQTLAAVSAASALPSYAKSVAASTGPVLEKEGNTMLNRYIIERDIPGVNEMSTNELCGAARASNQAITELSPQIQWEHSYVVKDKTYCIYLAQSEAVIREHAALSGIPVKNISLVDQVIDPLTANLEAAPT